MPIRFNFQVIYLITAVIISLYICIYAWRNPKLQAARSFSVACFTSILWMTGDIIGRLNSTFSGQWFGEIVRFVGVASLPVALLVFIYRYCGKQITRRQIYYLSVVPVISFLIMLTNPWHLLIFKEMQIGVMNAMHLEYNYYFWLVHLPYCYGLMFVGFVTILYEASRASRHHRTQIYILLFSICIPFVVNILGTFHVFTTISYTSLSFPVFFMIMAVAIFRYRFLFSNPIAYKTVFQNIRDGVFILDRKNTILDINPAAAAALKKTPGEIIGKKFEKAFEAWKQFVDEYADKADLCDEIELDLAGAHRHISVSITTLENADKTLNGRVFTLRDITDSKQYQISLETLAFHDPLTRVANRRKFAEEGEIAVEKSKKDGKPFGILYFDVNDFKAVNDTFGHETGDEFLKYIAARVASILRKPDLLARFGGDEFALLLHECDAAGMELVLERLLKNVQRPFQVGGHTLVADLSIGTAYFPDNGTNLNELLRYADAQMYLAKQKSREIVLPNNEISVSETSNSYLS